MDALTPTGDPSGQLVTYLRLLRGTPLPGQHFDIRSGGRDAPMQRWFVRTDRLPNAARLITGLALTADVYVGVALRDGDTYGGRRAISGSHLLYIECDSPNSADRSAGLAYPPTLEVASGTPGHLHLYWRLTARANNAQVEDANRRLARRLGGDMASVDIARILRPPGTFNYKHDPPTPVTLTEFRAGARYTLAQITAALPAESPVVPVGGRGTRLALSHVERDLLAIPAAEYTRILVGLAPDRAGKIRCPFHPDSTPSLQLYADGGFFCFGCRRGGSIFDFAANLWGITPRERGFIELRSRLAAVFTAAGVDRS
jgi:hypothetical protein